MQIDYLADHQEFIPTLTHWLGFAMPVTHDMDTRMDLSPWLAGVFVSPEQRRYGVGAALVQRVIVEARALGVRLSAQRSFTRGLDGQSSSAAATKAWRL
jgi:GNAT superfamily N-acetyltransferase